jgi:predicted ABC-type sugar transport system permease subunit
MRLQEDAGGVWPIPSIIAQLPGGQEMMEAEVNKPKRATAHTQDVAAPGVGARARSILRKLLLSEYFVLYLSIVYFLVLWPFIPRIASPQNLGNVFSNMWPLLAVAIGQTFVLIVAGIDLSQTSVMAQPS